MFYFKREPAFFVVIIKATFLGYPMKVIVIIIGLLILGVLGWYLYPTNPLITSKTKTLHYKFLLTNTTKHLAKNVEFYSHAPVKQTPYQQCLKIHTSPPCEVLKDESGNQILHFTFDQLAPYAKQIVTIEAVVEMYDVSRKENLKNKRQWLRPEPFVESNDPQIVTTSNQLQQNDSISTTKAIFDFVADHITYSGYLRSERGARYALKHRKGDCTEYADLFTALCRAGGIPSQRMGGYIFPQEAGQLNGNRYHNWSQAFIKNHWIIVDPQNRIFNERPDEYIAMKIIDGQKDPEIPEFYRFKIIGDNVAVKMES